MHYVILILSSHLAKIFIEDLASFILNHVPIFVITRAIFFLKKIIIPVLKLPTHCLAARSSSFDSEAADFSYAAFCSDSRTAASSKSSDGWPAAVARGCSRSAT